MESLKRKKSAEKYNPLETNILYIAESPPSAPGRYFYCENVKTDDWLWIGLMRAIYLDEFGETSIERQKKPMWLTRFKHDGYRLIDAIKVPICRSIISSKREKLIRNRTSEIVKEVKTISPSQIVLIKATVYDALYIPLKEQSFPVVNARLYFPSSGRQNKFHEEFRKLVEDGDVILTR